MQNPSRKIQTFYKTNIGINCTYKCTKCNSLDINQKFYINYYVSSFIYWIYKYPWSTVKAPYNILVSMLITIYEFKKLWHNLYI